MIITCATGIIVLIILFGYSFMGNRLVNLKKSADITMKDLNNQLKQRHERFNALIDTVKDSINDHQDLLDIISICQTKIASAQNLLQISQAESQLNEILNRLYPLLENIPELQENNHVQQLQQSLIAISSRIMIACRRYNDIVRDLNSKLDTPPYSTIAKTRRYTKMALLDLTSHE